MLDGPGQGVGHSWNGFNIIVKNNDRSVFGMLNDVLQAFFGRQAQVEVATHNVPHDYFVFVFQESILFPGAPTVGGPEQRGGGYLVASLNVVEILLIRCFPAFQVVVGMIPNLMTLVDNTLKNFGMAAYILAYAEKGGLHAEAF